MSATGGEAEPGEARSAQDTTPTGWTIMTANVAGRMGGRALQSDGRILLRLLADRRPDALLLQDTATTIDREYEANRIIRANADGRGVCRVDSAPGHGGSRTVGGVTTVVSGVLGQRHVGAEADCREWDRFVITSGAGRHGQRFHLCNVYVPFAGAGRWAREGDNGDSLHVQLSRRAHEERRAQSQRTGAQAEDLITESMANDPVDLLLRDITRQLKGRALSRSSLVIVAGDMNIDGRARHAGLQRMQEQLNLVEVDRDARLSTTVGTAGGRQLDRVFVSEWAKDLVRLEVIEDDQIAALTDHKPVMVRLDTVATLGRVGEPKKANTTKLPFKMADRQQRLRFKEIARVRWEDRSGSERAESAVLKLEAAASDAAAAAAERERTNGQPWADRRAEPGGLREAVNEATGALYDHIVGTLQDFASSGAVRRRHVRTGNGRRSYGDGWSPQSDAILGTYHRAKVTARWIKRGRYALATREATKLRGEGMPLHEPKTEAAFEWQALRDDLLREAAKARKQLHARKRAERRRGLKAGSMKKQEQKRARMTKRVTAEAMGKRRDGPPHSLQTSDGDVVTDPRDMAELAQRFGEVRGNDAQPHWMVKKNLAEGHEIWAVVDEKVTAGTVAEVDGNGTVRCKKQDGTEAAVPLTETCLRWQVSENPTVPEVRAAATDRTGDDEVHPAFGMDKVGERLREQILAGDPEVAAAFPAQFRRLLPALQRKYSALAGCRLTEALYHEMVNEDGTPRDIDDSEWRTAVRRTPKGKAPGANGVTADAVALQPKGWHAMMCRVANVITKTGISPEQWRRAVTTYIHKGGSDRTLSNFRPIMLLDVVQKVVMKIHNTRMNAAWRRLGAITEQNAGFQKSRTTASSILPVRMAARMCKSQQQNMAALFDDLAWAFDCPPRGVIELALRRLGVPTYFVTLLRDMDNMSMKDTALAGGLASSFNGQHHRVLHGTPQGSVEGPSLWMAVEDIVVDWTETSSRSPMYFDAGPAEGVEVASATFVDDGAMFQCGAEANADLTHLANETGLIHYFLGNRRRAKKVVYTQMKWVEGRLQRVKERPEAGLCIKQWTTDWATGSPVVREWSTTVKEYDYDEEFRHLGYTASLTGCDGEKLAEMKRETERVMQTVAAKRSLKRWTREVIETVLQPKLAYQLAFSNATSSEIGKIEAKMTAQLFNALGLARTTAWGIVAGDPAQGGIGFTRLQTITLMQRMQHMLQLHLYGTRREQVMMQADLWAAQLWAGTSTPAAELTREQALRLRHGRSEAPWTAVVLLQMAEAGYKVRGLGSNPRPAERDVAVMEATELDEFEWDALQEWRRGKGILWMSQLLQGDGCTVSNRWHADIAAGKRSDGPLGRALSRLFPSSTTPRVSTGRLNGTAGWRLRRDDGFEAKGRIMRVIGRRGKMIRAITLEPTGAARYREAGETYVSTDEVTGYADVRTASGRARADGEGATLTLGQVYSVAPSDGDPEVVRLPRMEVMGWGWWADPDSAHRKVHGVANERMHERSEIIRARRDLASAVERARGETGDEPVKVELYTDGSSKYGNTTGSAAVLAYVNGRRVAEASTPMLAAGVRLASTRAERLGVLMAYEVTAGLERAGPITVRIDNRGAVTTGNSAAPTSMRQRNGVADADIVGAIHERKEERERRGEGDLTFEWVRGHADERGHEARTEHHERNQAADAATKRAGKTDPIWSVGAPGRRAVVTYEFHKHENCAAEVVVPGRLRAHVRSSERRRVSYEYWEKTYARRYRMPGGAGKRAGMMVESPAPQLRGKALVRRAKTINDLHADESRKRVYAGAETRATCICGQQYDRIGHIWFGCPHPALCSIRQRWRQRLIEEVQAVAPNSPISPTAFVDALWSTRPSEGGCVVQGAEEAEKQQYRETLQVPTANSSSGDSDSEERGGGGLTGGNGSTCEDRDAETGSDDGGDTDGKVDTSEGSDEECGLGDATGRDAAPTAASRRAGGGPAGRAERRGWTRTGKQGKRESYAVDWNGLDDDPPRRALEILKEAKYNMTIQEWWGQRMTQDIPALMSTALGLDHGGGMVFFRRAEELSAVMTDTLWTEYTRTAHTTGSAVHEAKRRELLDEWAALKADMGNMTDNRGNGMVSLNTASKWTNPELERLNAKWRAIRDRHRRRLGKGQRTITATMNIRRTARKRKEAGSGSRPMSAGGGGAERERGGGYGASDQENTTAEEALRQDENGGVAYRADGRAEVMRGSRAPPEQSMENGQGNRKRAAAAAEKRGRPHKAQTTLRAWLRGGRGAMQSSRPRARGRMEQGRSADSSGAGGTENRDAASDQSASVQGAGGTDGREDDPG